MIRELPFVHQIHCQAQGLSPCDYRTTSQDGRIVCLKIVAGNDEVSPNLCRSCPFKATNCAHLRFTLRQISPSPLVVRYNGRTEIWDNDPPEIRFEHAACAARVLPIEHPRACVGCALRQPLQAPVQEPRQRVARPGAGGKVVPFPTREVLAATG